MTVAAKGNECLVTLDGQQFVTQRLESAALLERLARIRHHTVLLEFMLDAPYRCVGSAIITLQRAKVTFRAPQIPSK